MATAGRGTAIVKTRSEDRAEYPWVIRDVDLGDIKPVIPELPPEVPDRLKLLAPPVQTDKYPLVIGQNLTGAYLSSVYRLCTTGWRYQYVDALTELLEHDGHARGVTRQRVLTISGARITVQAAKLRQDHPDAGKATDLAEAYEESLFAIPGLRQALGQLNWAVVYGVSALETIWDRVEDGWETVGLSSIHNRRLNYPDPWSWDLRIYDQGLAGPSLGLGRTNGLYGLRVADVPGKFIVHTPALNGDYPTRDGEGRYLGFLMLIKRMVMRATAQDFERTIRPWVVGYFNREGQIADKSIAQPEDIAALNAALKSFGAGSMNAAALPDSVKVELLKAASALNARDFLSFLNQEESKTMLGQSFTTEPGANGNLTTAEIAKEGTQEIFRYDASALEETWKRDHTMVWMRLNYPGVKPQLCPRLVLNVDEAPEPKERAQIAQILTAMDVPLDVDDVAEQSGFKAIAGDDKKSRRTRAVVGGKGLTPTAGEDPNEGDVTVDENESTGETPDTKDDKKNGKAKKPKPDQEDN